MISKLLVVDDHPLFRQGLSVTLRSEARFEVVAEVNDSMAALAVIERQDIDVAIVDVLMPGLSGISLSTEIYERQPSCRVLGLSVIDDPGLIADMLRAHGCGYALKTQPVAEIIHAIDPNKSSAEIRHYIAHCSGDARSSIANRTCAVTANRTCELHRQPNDLQRD